MKATHREQLAIWGPLLLLILAGLVVAFHYMKPAPPKKITIATGEPGGAYFAFAQEYRKRLKEQGLELEILQTHGAVENLELLVNGRADVAFLQGGVGGNLRAPVEGLGSLYYEPLWLFYRAGLEVSGRLPSLLGMQVSLGADGSGTQALVRTLLRDNGFPDHAPNLLALSSEEAARRLEAGTLDAAFFVSSPKSRVIRQLIRSDRVRPASFERAEAYARRYPYITDLLFPEGAEDLARNLPDRDLHLLATTSSLVVRSGTHPAVVTALMQVIDAVHGRPGWFGQAGEFPTPNYLAFPLNPQADHYYRNGPPFLQRYLPFWAAAFLDRIKIMLLPLLGLLLPMFKIGPPLYRWRMRSRIYRWYEKLEDVDVRAANDPQADPGALEAILDGLEREVRDIKVPLAFSDQLYHLRLHIDLVRRRMQEEFERRADRH